MYGVKTKIEYEWAWQYSKQNWGVVDIHYRDDCIYEPHEEEEHAVTLLLIKKFCNWDYGVIDEIFHHLNVDTWEFKPPLPTKYLQKYFEKKLPMIKNIKNISNGY